MPYFDKDIIKDEISEDDVFTLLQEFDADPKMCSDYIVARTVCHGGEAHKLYYYFNNRIFTCYTDCGESFDIFDLVSKVKGVDFNTAIFYLVNFFNLQHKVDAVEQETLSEDWKIIRKWNELLNISYTPTGKMELPTYDSAILSNFPQPRILDWEDEHITKEVCDYMNIHYDPSNGSILIPHYNDTGQLIGIRERTLIKDNEKYGKYRPARIEGKLYNHPLGFNLYGLDKAKGMIGDMGIAVVTEAEKSVFQIMSYLGTKSSMAVSMCGSTLSNYQFHQLLDIGAKEICIAVDRDYHELYDDEYDKILTKIERMYNKYSPLCKISFMFDTAGLTGYKCSPTDCGKDVFLRLWKDRLVV